MRKYRAVSLFSNCGAGDVGYRSAGFTFEVMAELEESRLEVCLLNHPGAIGVSGDLRETWPKVISAYRKRARETRPALLCACPPCQGMSSAQSGRGKHADADAGSKDDRNLLVTVIAKVAKRLMPALIVVENVSAFLSRRVRHPQDDKPVTAAQYLISALSRDYIAYPFVGDLADFGIPQSRNRAFLTLIRRDVAGLREFQRLNRAPFPRPTHSGAAGEQTQMSLDAALASFELPELDSASPAQAQNDAYGGFHAVPVWDGRIYEMVAAIPAGSGESAWKNNRCKFCGPVRVDEKSVFCPECQLPLLRPIVKDYAGGYRLIKGFKTSYRRMAPNRPAATITTASGHVGSDYTIHPTQNRVLSTLECALLQTFPPDFSWGDALTKYGHTNVREMIGEAVPPAFTRMHGAILLGLLRSVWTATPISASDDRCTKARKKLRDGASKDGRRLPLLGGGQGNAHAGGVVRLKGLSKNSSVIRGRR